MSPLKKIYTSLLFIILIASSAIAQSADDQVEMADAMHANGKIYVVVAVLSVVFAGIVIYLITIDRKVSRLEKEITKKK